MRLVAPSRIRGELSAPPSKSMTVRALAAGLLSRGVTRIENVSFCEDALVAAGAVEDLGGTVERRERTFIVHGTSKESLASRAGQIDCGESGLSFRMFAPIAALCAGETALLASGSLRSRPMSMIDALRQLGVVVRTEKGHAPVFVKGPMRGGIIHIDASVSSQFLTGLLMALPLCGTPSIIRVSALKSTPYVGMTLELLRAFGVQIVHDERFEEFTVGARQMYHPIAYSVEGDWSGAAFLLVAGATAGAVKITGLDPSSAQADKAILDVLELVGATVLKGPSYVGIETRELRPFAFDATACPDLFPPLVALASSCGGTSVIHGVDRLAHKESDRAAALRLEFGRLGVSITIVGNSMEVHGGRINGGVVNAHKDHRIAMACAIAGLRAGKDVSIEGAECVAKSYPEFFSDLGKLRIAG